MQLPDDPIRQLRAWQRFHLRITALYAVAVFTVLTVAAVTAYVLAFQSSLGQLQQRLQVAVTALADGIDPHALAALDADAAATPYQRELQERFRTLGELDPRFNSIYVIRWTGDPSDLRILADWDDEGEEASWGQHYDASELPVLLQGFDVLSVEQEPYRDEWGWSLSAYAPLRLDGERLALVGVDVDVDELRALRLQVLGLTSASWVVAALLIAVASIQVGRNVRDPLSRVIDATAAIARGQFATRLSLERSDEFGLMSRHFDAMAQGLEERETIRETFGLYVDPTVARALLEDGPRLGGEEREVTVLFTDLRGYSTISEQLDPTQLVALLNEYLGGMQEVLDAHGGTVIEFLGDAILAVFGAPHASDDHPERAVRCAVAMRARMAELNARWARDGLAEHWQRVGLAELGHRVGVHTGTVVAGNVGSATRMKYTVIGDAVNVAARLEQLNKQLGTDVLLSGETVDRLSAPLREEARSRGEVQVKGRAEPVRVFEVRGGL